MACPSCSDGSALFNVVHYLHQASKSCLSSMLEPSFGVLSRAINPVRDSPALYSASLHQPLGVHSQTLKVGTGRGRPSWKSLGKAGGELCDL